MNARPRTLVISNIAWNFVWQRHQTMASLFAQDSNVCFCEVPGTRRIGLRDTTRVLARLGALRRPADAVEAVPPGVQIVRPFVLPATNPIFHRGNKALLRRFIHRSPELAAGVDLILNYSASRSALTLIDLVPHRQLVYDCTDDWLAVRGIPACLPGDERALLARADLTLAPSRRLTELKGPHARRIVRVPHGAWVERFAVAARARAPQDAITVLYYGHLHAQHLDFGALDALARARPVWRIVLVGPVKSSHAFPPNVELPGQQPHDRLVDFVRNADVLLLPYVLNDYTRSVLPAKTYECLATGRPIVATPLPELVADFSASMRFASNGDDYVREIEAALVADSSATRAARIALAEANTWQSRYREIRALLAGATRHDPT